MPKKITAAAVPPLALSPQDETELRQLSFELQCELLAQYEEYLFHCDRCVDDLRWKKVRSDGDLHAYRERKAAVPDFSLQEKHAAAFPGVAATASGPLRTLVEQSPIPLVLITGLMPGTVDELMYGFSYHDTQSYSAFYVSQCAVIEESAILATLETPTLDDPYRFLGVGWFLRTYPLNIMQHRDFLTLEMARITMLGNGERVGVNIHHSIEHRDLTELRELKTIRATSSLLTVYRQHDDQRVEVYQLHFFDSKGLMPDKVDLQESVKQLMPLAAAMGDIGLRKKLQWLMRRRDKEHQAAALCDAIEPMSSGSNERCEVCDRAFGKLFSCAGTSCQLCYKRVCSKCSVSQRLTVPVSAMKSVLRPHDFCIGCVLEAKATPALAVAQEEVMHQFDSGSKLRERELTTLMSADAALYYMNS